MTDPFKHTNGPRDAEILIVGEAWGNDEALQQQPFIGQAGKELDRMLFDAGIRRSEVLCTNVVDARPNEGNDFAAGFTVSRGTTTGGVRAGLPSTPLRGLAATEKLVEGHRKLLALIDVLKPKVIVGCGNWPLWALTSHGTLKTVKSKYDNNSYKIPSGIKLWRGSQTFTDEINGTKYPYLPIVHPASILRDWTERAITVHDLRARASRFTTGTASWSEPKLAANPAPSFESAVQWLTAAIKAVDLDTAGWLTVDVETYQRRSLVCVGLAYRGGGAICIPFFHFGGVNGSYQDVWSLDQEVELSALLRKLLGHPRARISNQNIIYDFQYLQRLLHVRIRPSFDTMVAHHLLWPGTPKKLERLASLYCDHYLYWKEESDEWDTKVGHLDLWTYNCKDVLYTLEITEALDALIDQQGMRSQFTERMEQWEVVADIMSEGMNYDNKLRQQYQLQLLETATEIGNWLLEAMPTNIRHAASGKPWFTSPLHQQLIFYTQLGLKPILHKVTKRPTLDASSFELLRKQAPWLSALFDRLELMRSIGVFSSHFLDIKLMPNGRFGTEYNIAGTETFRWSSHANAFDEGTNFQNTPKIEEE